MIFFVHIAKTAGSTMNRYLAEHYPRGVDHCEQYLNDGTAFAERVREADWMSGHVPLPNALGALSPLRPDVRYYTCVRKPAAQVRSHYNWLVEIYNKGDKFYSSHPPIIKEISAKVRETIRRPTPAAVSEDLVRFAGLFLNSQIRFIVGQQNFAKSMQGVNAGALSIEDIPIAFSHVLKFSAIGDSDHIENLFNYIHGANVYTKENRTKENVSRYHFDPDLFESDEVKTTLAAHSRLDGLLYGYLQQQMTDGLFVTPAGAAPSSLSGRRLG